MLRLLESKTDNKQFLPSINLKSGHFTWTAVPKWPFFLIVKNMFPLFLFFHQSNLSFGVKIIFNLPSCKFRWRSSMRLLNNKNKGWVREVVGGCKNVFIQYSTILTDFVVFSFFISMKARAVPLVLCVLFFSQLKCLSSTFNCFCFLSNP